MVLAKPKSDSDAPLFQLTVLQFAMNEAKVHMAGLLFPSFAYLQPQYSLCSFLIILDMALPESLWLSVPIAWNVLPSALSSFPNM